MSCLPQACCPCISTALSGRQVLPAEASIACVMKQLVKSVNLSASWVCLPAAANCQHAVVCKVPSTATAGMQSATTGGTEHPPYLFGTCSAIAAARTPPLPAGSHQQQPDAALIDVPQHLDR